MNPVFLAILLNILGGSIVVIIFSYIYPFFKKTFQNYSFKKFFGDDIDNFSLIYGSMQIRNLFEKKEEAGQLIYKPIYNDNGELIGFPYEKIRSKGYNFRVYSITSLAELRSAQYISEAFSKSVQKTPIFVPDDEIEEKLDFSFCSLGGRNNLKTNYVLNSEENRFYDFGKDFAIIERNGTGKGLGIEYESGAIKYDHGLVVKIIPKNFPKRVWFAIAGVGEWGTSGAAWYLAKKWRELPKNKSFGLTIRVQVGKDESAEAIKIID